MSSTNRRNTRSATSDYYRTPVPAILDFFDALQEDWHEVLNTEAFSFTSSYTVLDPCGGGDSEHDMSYPLAISQHPLWKQAAKVMTVDVRPDSRAELKADYLVLPTVEGQPAVIISNPPFNLAQRFIEKALLDVQPGGVVIMLLRLNFLGAQHRATFFSRQTPLAVYVHSKRMRFSDSMGADSVEYAHFIWQQGVKRKYSMLRRVNPKYA